MTNTLLLKSYFVRNGVVIDEVARRMGIARGTLSSKVNNKTEFTVSEITKLCEILSISSNDKELIFFNID